MATGSFVTTGLSEVMFLPDDVILAQGKTSDRVYLLKYGTVAVEIDGHEVCRIVDPESIFGEMSALLNCPHTATVKALSECLLYEITDLRAYCQAHPAAALYMVEIMARRLMNMNQRFSEFKAELATMDPLGKELSFAKQLNKLILRLDQFWGRDIFETKPQRK